MKLFLSTLLVLVTVSLFGQAQKPTTSKSIGDTAQAAKAEPVYLTPVSFKEDTVQVFAVLATLRQPLTLQPYQVIVKSWVYENGKTQVADERMEKVVDQIVTPIPNFKKRLLFVIRADEFQE